MKVYQKHKPKLAQDIAEGPISERRRDAYTRLGFLLQNRLQPSSLKRLQAAVQTYLANQMPITEGGEALNRYLEIMTRHRS